MSNAAGLGDDILQSGPGDGTSSNAPVRTATLTDSERLRFRAGVNSGDSPIALLDDVGTATRHIMTIGLPANPPVATFVGQSVVKHGQTAGLTFDSAGDPSFDGKRPLQRRRRALRRSNCRRRRHTVPSRSAATLDPSSLTPPAYTSLGLLFARANFHTIADPIQSVLNRFGATVAVTSRTCGKPNAPSDKNSAPLTTSWRPHPQRRHSALCQPRNGSCREGAPRQVGHPLQGLRRLGGSHRRLRGGKSQAS